MTKRLTPLTRYEYSEDVLSLAERIYGYILLAILTVVIAVGTVGFISTLYYLWKLL